MGGRVVRIRPAGEVVEVVVQDTTYIGDFCALRVDQGEHRIHIGDSLWADAQWAYWTPKGRSVTDVKLKRFGYSYRVDFIDAAKVA